MKLVTIVLMTAIWRTHILANMSKMQSDKQNKLPNFNFPRVIFGTSGLGNLFQALHDDAKFDIVSECVHLSRYPVIFDSAGKYGAGLALDSLGKSLKRLQVSPDKVVISNKLGWLRTALKTSEPTFEPGVWKNLTHDAIQKISYEGILECFDQGNMLLGEYIPQMVSVHDPDEYLATAKDEQHKQQRYQDILDAYRALNDLKHQGKVKAIGVGAKNWRVIQQIEHDVKLDWVMIANSMTIKSHPRDLLDFIAALQKKGVLVINSAVFHSGFLVGSDYFDYKPVRPGTPENEALYKWRDEFFLTCKAFGVTPATACVQFALNIQGVSAIALNTTHAKRVKENITMVDAKIPFEFWNALKEKSLIEVDFVHRTEPVL